MEQPHVLILDDEEVHRQTLAEVLTGGGIRVTACDSAHTALEALRRPTRFDLILSDVMMPGMNGLEFARAARALRPEVPLVLVTGRESGLELVEGAGAFALLKPYSAEGLNGVLREHLGRTI
jgi:CheY-like chemotaxis protein